MKKCKIESILSISHQIATDTISRLYRRTIRTEEFCGKISGRWGEFFCSIDETLLDIDSDDISAERFTLDRRRRTPEEWIKYPSSLFRISLNKVFGDLWDEVPVIEVIMFSSFLAIRNHPETIHIQIYLFPILQIEIIIVRHRYFYILPILPNPLRNQIVF